MPKARARTALRAAVAWLTLAQAAAAQTADSAAPRPSWAARRCRAISRRGACSSQPISSWRRTMPPIAAAPEHFQEKVATGFP